MKKIDIKSVLIGLLIGTNFIFLLGAKQKADHIEAKSITIFNDDGEKIAYFGKDANGQGRIYFNRSDGALTLSMASIDGNGVIATFNKYEKETVYIGTDKSSNGILVTNKYDGEKTIFLGTGTDLISIFFINMVKI